MRIKIQCIKDKQWSEFDHVTTGILPIGPNDVCEKCGKRDFNWKSTISVRSYNEKNNIKAIW